MFQIFCAEGQQEVWLLVKDHFSLQDNSFSEGRLAYNAEELDKTAGLQSDSELESNDLCRVACALLLPMHLIVTAPHPRSVGAGVGHD